MQKIQPFKKYREMDDDQRRTKSEETRKKISATLKARWAATPRKTPTTIEDIMLEGKPPVKITEDDIRQMVMECVRRLLTNLFHTEK